MELTDRGLLLPQERWGVTNFKDGVPTATARELFAQLCCQSEPHEIGAVTDEVMVRRLLPDMRVRPNLIRIGCLMPILPPSQRRLTQAISETPVETDFCLTAPTQSC